jgi:DnaJ-class molecular chaperone
MPTHYEVLRVHPNADEATLKQAYHRAARQFHPDKQQGSDDMESFRQVQAAWECLRDSHSRKIYDLALLQQQHTHHGLPNTHQVLHVSDCHLQSIVDHNGEMIDVFMYTCRCGQDNEITDDPLLECTGCSLLYDTSAIE